MFMDGHTMYNLWNTHHVPDRPWAAGGTECMAGKRECDEAECVGVAGKQRVLCLGDWERALPVALMGPYS